MREHRFTRAGDDHRLLTRSSSGAGTSPGPSGSHQETAVSDLAALLRAQETPQLLLPGPAVLCGLPQERLPGPQVALGPDDLLDPRRAQRADELVLQVCHAHEEAPVRSPRPPQSVVVEALLALVAQAAQAQTETGRAREDRRSGRCSWPHPSARHTPLRRRGPGHVVQPVSRLRRGRSVLPAAPPSAAPVGPPGRSPVHRGRPAAQSLTASRNARMSVMERVCTSPARYGTGYSTPHGRRGASSPRRPDARGGQASIPARSLLSVRVSSRETCICETPSSAPICDWVISCAEAHLDDAALALVELLEQRGQGVQVLHRLHRRVRLAQDVGERARRLARLVVAAGRSGMSREPAV